MEEKTAVSATGSGEEKLAVVEPGGAAGGAAGEAVGEPELAAPALSPELPLLSPGERLRNWLNYSDRDFKAGNLIYTRKALLIMCVWLLWGDLVFTLSDQHVYNSCMALQLDRIGIPKQWVGYIMGTAGAWINLFMVPLISFRSDRTRSRWGRRLPYIFWTIVPLCIFLAALGFTDEVAAFIRHSDWPARLHVQPTTLVIAVIATMIILFDVANVFVNCVFWYLLRDVVPVKFIARFMTVFGIVGTLTNMIWSKFFMPIRQTHTSYLYVGASLLYLFGFSLMCLMVKEPEYPPPEPVKRSDTWMMRFRKACKVYFTESFQHPLILMLYAGTAISVFVNACALYQTYFQVRYLGFKDKDLGDFGVITLAIILVIKYPIGWLIDKKIHPMKSMFYSSILLLPVPFMCFYMQDYQIGKILIPAFTIYMLITLYQLPIVQFNALSGFPLVTKLFPGEQFGQFSSANQIVGNVIKVGAGIAGATFMGWMDFKFGNEGNKYLWLWHGLFNFIGFASLCVMFRYWFLYGGANFKLDLNAVPGIGGPSRSQLWRPIQIFACVSAVVLVVGGIGIVVLAHRPDVSYTVNVDDELKLAKTREQLQERVGNELAGMKEQHERALVTLAAKHWFYASDTLKERKNYEDALKKVAALQRARLDDFDKKLATTAASTTAATAPATEGGVHEGGH